MYTKSITLAAALNTSRVDLTPVPSHVARSAHVCTHALLEWHLGTCYEARQPLLENGHERALWAAGLFSKRLWEDSDLCLSFPIPFDSASVDEPPLSAMPLSPATVPVTSTLSYLSSSLP